MAANLGTDVTGLTLSDGPGINTDQTDGDRVQEITMRTAELVETIGQNLTAETAADPEIKLKNKHLVWSHLNSCYCIGPPSEEVATGKTSETLLQPKNPINIVFDSGFEWINTNDPPNLNDESTRSIIILEFFTHCCINCIHSIEDVRQVYNKITSALQRDGSANGCQLKIISVHSPKFTREKDTDSIRAFVKRNNMTHTDVVNDPNCKLWNALSIYCWPTLLIFGPSPTKQLNLLFTMVGEGQGHKEILEHLLESSLEYFNSKIDFTQVQIVASVQNHRAIDVTTEEASPAAMLRFPGKVVLHNGHLVISDSGNNRLILCTIGGHVKEIIGGTQSGYVDGDFTSARFYNPQGVAFYDDSVFYVADTGNHCVRKIDLKTRMVSTIVEPNASTTGDNDQILRLKSPWDVAFYGNDVLLIAAAGNHQLFCYTFKSVQLFSIARVPSSFDLVAGSGKEENRNNMYIRKASFCQPSGISVSQVLNENDKVIYVADTESSTIRVINSAGRVMPFVGGTKDPTDLFAYGDVDGCGYDVRLQHPVGVCSAIGSTKVFIADTYNHKIKMIDCETKHCTTVIGNGVAGNVEGVFSGHVVPPKRRSNSPSPSRAAELALLNEPNGLTIDQSQNFLYIADTNNHCIKVANLKCRTVCQLKLQFPQENANVSTVDGPLMQTQKQTPAVGKFDQDYLIKLSSASAFGINLKIHGLPTNLEGGEWRALRYNETTPCFTGTLAADGNTGTAMLENLQVPNDSNLIVQVHILFCGAASCYRKTLKFHLLAEIDETASADQAFELDYHPPETFFNEN